jgi:hypothetical protein
MDGKSNFVIDKGDRKAYLKAKHLGRPEKQLFMQVVKQSFFFFPR